MRRRLLIALPLVAAACAAGREQPPPGSRQAFVVFFEDGSATLGAEANAAMDDAAALARRYAAVKLVVAGYADPEGASEANKVLSKARARAVADGLIARGVAPDRLTVVGRGATGVAYSSLEARRVEVRVAG